MHFLQCGVCVSTCTKRRALGSLRLGRDCIDPGARVLCHLAWNAQAADTNWQEVAEATAVVGASVGINSS